VYYRVGTNIRKCIVWSQNTEPGTRVVWRVELHVSLELNSLLLHFIVLDVEFCKTNNVIKKNKIYP
jgi:hypothetical protein